MAGKKEDWKSEMKKKAEKIKKKEQTIKEKPKQKEVKKTDVLKKASIPKHWQIIKHPHLTEKSISRVEQENKIVFIVDRKANSLDIKKAVEDAFKTKVAKINTLTDMKGRKKAFVKLKKGESALDIATKLGMI